MILLNHFLIVGGEQYDIVVLLNNVILIKNSFDLSVNDGGVTELSTDCICCGPENKPDQELKRLAFETELIT
ncbi:hypothetical protein [Halostagnicola kamekurae]|uniref:hypothetical protein n=1 Tax=Halostagnicola kamekurae TaxID=619731 RepID=UPI001C318665|nr:hypothetical protein [Halostagnicola kamekurae]